MSWSSQIRETYHLDMRRNAFSSKRKKMSVLLRTRDKQGLLYVKGAGQPCIHPPMPNQTRF